MWMLFKGPEGPDQPRRLKSQHVKPKLNKSAPTSDWNGGRWEGGDAASLRKYLCLEMKNFSKEVPVFQNERLLEHLTKKQNKKWTTRSFIRKKQRIYSDSKYFLDPPPRQKNDLIYNIFFHIKRFSFARPPPLFSQSLNFEIFFFETFPKHYRKSHTPHTI